ncbi:pimD_small, pimeloyl-CoA dehydrogenase, small subunit [Burkholderiales bacterium]
MDFLYSEDQRAIREMAESIFGDHCTDAFQAEWDKRRDSYDAVLWDKLREAGLPSLLLTEASGGSALGMTDLNVVLQAQGRSIAPVPLAEHALGAYLLEREGLLTQEIAAGEQVVSLALDSLLDAREGKLSVGQVGESMSVSGLAESVLYGDVCSGLLVAAGVGSTASLLYVDLRPEKGVVRMPGRTQHHQGVADIHLTQAPAVLLKTVTVNEALERALAAISALTLGVLEEQVRRAVVYTSERVQFGRAIGTFQAVQMRMADAQIDLEVLKTSLLQLLYRIDQSLPALPQASATKYLASEASHRVGHGAQHVHGGIGVDQSYPIHRYLYWARAMAMRLGGSGAHLERLGSWLDQHDTLGWKYDMKEDTNA